MTTPTSGVRREVRPPDRRRRRGPVNTDLVPNYADIYPDFKEQPYNSVDGQMYGVPYGRGANLLSYNTDEVKPAPTYGTWPSIPEKASEYKGNLTAYDNLIYIADAALYLMEHEPDRGSPTRTARRGPARRGDRPAQAAERERGRVPVRLREEHPVAGQRRHGRRHDVAVQLPAAAAEDPAITATIPDEGATGWSDTWMLSSEAENPNCAYEWFNHITEPQVQAEVAEWFGEAPANAKACDLTSDPKHCETTVPRATTSTSTGSTTGRPWWRIAAMTAAMVHDL